MEKTLPLYLGPSVIGSVVCSENDGHITLLAKTYASLRGICRAYVRGSEGKLLIGVLAPDGTAFSAEKTVSKTALREKGLAFDKITYAYAISSVRTLSEEASEWKRIEPRTCELLRRDDVVYALAKSTDALTDNSFSPTQLAIPLITGRPFPRPDIMCLLTPYEIGGKLYGVLGISKNGAPRRI